MAYGGVVGLIVALQVLDPQFIAGTGGKWIRPENDYIAYLVAWHYYVIDAWRFPIFDLPAMGYPEGGNVLFNDALPLASIPTRMLYRWTGTPLNPFGWWILLTYVLQGAMAARLVCATGVSSIWASIAAAVLAVVNVAFVARMGHIALSSHFLLLWMLAIYVESVRAGRVKAIELTAALAVSLLVNSYLFAMVFAVALVLLLTLAVHRRLLLRDLLHVAGGLALVALLGLVAGYGLLFTNPASMKSEGFGLYSWNLLSLLVPPRGIFGVLAIAPRYGTHGQYEGEAYIGAGALILFLACIAINPARVIDALRRYKVYAAMLVVFAIFAASNRVYAGSALVVHYGLPQVAIDLANYFRATGRFIWPLSYSLAILPVACLFKWWPRAAAIALAAVAIWVQVEEARGELRYRRALTTQSYEDLIDAPRIEAWLAQHERLWQYPSWACGGLEGPTRRWASREANRELQLQLSAARVGIPTNSVYTSRVLKDCEKEAEWLTHVQLEPGVFYVLSPVAVRESQTLATLAASDSCVTLDWAVVCSTRWVNSLSKPADPITRGK